jgi:hypothetical protein
MAKELTKRQRFWLKHVHAAMAGGKSLQQYAKVHRLSSGALYNAKSVLRRSGALEVRQAVPGLSAFMPVQLVASSAEPIRCRLQHAQWQLEMERLPDPQWLLALMRSGDGDVAA